MCLRVNDHQLFKKYNEIWKKKNEKLMRIQFESKRTYGYNNHKYIRTILKIYAVSMITFS